MHTYDIYKEGISKEKVGTKEFAEAVVQRLGQSPQILKSVKYQKVESKAAAEGTVTAVRTRARKELVGVDVFLDWSAGSANELGTAISRLAEGDLKLVVISNRGVKVWPGGHAETFCSDHWRCRFLAQNSGITTHSEIVSLLKRVGEAGYDSIKTENLYNFDGQRGYSLDQGA